MSKAAERAISEEKERRIQLYSQRADAGLGIFDGLPIPQDDNPRDEDMAEESSDNLVDA